MIEQGEPSVSTYKGAVAELTIFTQTSMLISNKEAGPTKGQDGRKISKECRTSVNKIFCKLINIY